MDWKDVAKRAANAGASLLGFVLPQNYAEPIQKAVAKLTAKDENATPDQVVAALDADPSLLLELKKYELDNQLELAKIAANLDMAAVADMANNRELAAVEVKSEDWFVRRARPAMLWSCVVSFTMNFALVPLIQIGTWVGAVVSRGAAEAQTLRLEPPDMGTQYWLFMGTLFLGYSWLRTKEKTAETANGNGK